MTHAEMMAEIFAAHRESAKPWSCWHRLLVASPMEATGAMVGTGVVPVVLRDTALIRIS